MTVQNRQSALKSTLVSFLLPNYNYLQNSHFNVHYGINKSFWIITCCLFVNGVDTTPVYA